MFATGDPTLASIGRFMQGAGGVFALIGAVYIATTHFPATRAATLIGATQMFGMAGGSAGQFAVGPLMGMAFNGTSFGCGWGCRHSDRAAAIPAHSTAPEIRRRTKRQLARHPAGGQWGRCSSTRSRSCAA